MAFDWLRRETKSQYIARPAEAAHELVYYHPDRSIPRGAKLTVRSDECALFFREGRYIGRIDAGTALLDTANIPFLGHLLVDGFTGGNHFLCELFFVTLRETIEEVPPFEVGQFIDSNSRKVVKVIAELNYTMRVVDPPLLITGLGGQNAQSGIAVAQILAGRTATALRQSVATRASTRAILDIVSNIDVDAIGNELVAAAQAEFRPLGLEVVRAFDLRLDLDDESRQRLVEFGERESNLAYQAKGASIANQDGFTHFNAVQGQLAALEGLGKGLATGHSPMVLSGSLGGIGGGMGASATITPARRDVGRGGTPITQQVSFVLIHAQGDKGPYTARQLALVLIAEGLDPATASIRRSDDPASMAFTADLEPLVMVEFDRRRRAPATGVQPATPVPSAPAATSAVNMIDVLSGAIRAAGRDGRIPREAFAALAPMAQTLGLAADPQQASLLVAGLAAQAGLSIDQ
ncbi:MAG: SPFH domain-containing protein [Sphingomonadales bacterium]|nr:SPFH domain-containing protein [Sphingomonadales bacterium]MDE2171806.1 SPFH domain-containing protein [Sphingomonadales bacterium]